MIKDVSEWLWSVSWEKKLLTIFAPTNGTLLTREMRRWFSTNKARICLGLSFDGNSIMQNRNRSSSAPRIDLSFFASNWPEQSVKLTISPETIGSLFEGVRSLWDNGFVTVAADLAMGSSIPWTSSHLTMFRDELRKFVDYFANENNTVHQFSMMSIPVLSLSDKKRSYSGKQCHCGEDLVCIDINGAEYPCHLFSPVSITDTKRIEGIKSIVFSNHDAFNMNPCRDCYLNPICTVHCYGMNYKSYGSVSHNSPFHCHAFKLLFVENCRLQYLLAKRSGHTDVLTKLNELINQINHKHE